MARAGCAGFLAAHGLVFPVFTVSTMVLVATNVVVKHKAYISAMFRLNRYICIFDVVVVEGYGSQHLLV